MSDEATAMAPVRQEIDRLDKALMALLVERAACIDKATRIKRAHAIPARTRDRVTQVLANARTNANAVGFDPDLAERLWHELIEWSIAREETALRGTP